MADWPNLVVILSDQQRANAIHPYSNPDVLAPSLERPAARGRRFNL